MSEHTPDADDASQALPDSPSKPAPDFESLGLDPRLLEALRGLGYEEPTPIQTEAVPPLLEGRDLVGQAATGTGKSAAFALPLIQRLVAAGSDRPQPSVLILVPTRELAMQLSEAVYRYGRNLGVKVLPIYGGQSFSQQLKVLRRGVDIVVATPGRALDHIGRGTLRLEKLAAVVLDEADEMLDMGFAEDLEAILAATPEDRQTVLFSATMPPRIADIAARHLRDPVQVRIARPALAEGDAPQVVEIAYVVSRAHKIPALVRVLNMEEPEAAIIFCRTRHEVDDLAETLNAHGHRAEALHGGMSQEQRDRVMRRLRSGKADLLVATDVAARGLDIPRLTHVINFDVPNAPEAYVHRIGRVGRAGREGIAIILAEPREQRVLRSIEQLNRRPIEIRKLPTVADLRDRRLEGVRSTLLEILDEGDLDHFRGVVESLSDDFEAVDVASAALKLSQIATGQDLSDAREIPQVSPGEKKSRKKQGKHEGASRPRGRGSARKGARVFVGIGKDAGVRPKDLVGAITGEAGIEGRQIGKIQIDERFSIVEVAPDVVGEVIEALHGNTIKGRRVTVRRDQVRKRE
ncbi:MAG: DEAD/DEAH box helicase [Gemmatimonadales bacterium]|nr:MAG: DEAD/DEAH box helicase [Gemmatimonadales bacterium]